MSSASVSNPTSRLAGPSGFIVAEGVILIILGLVAVVFPIIAGVAAAVLFGWILFVSGLVGLVSAFRSRPHLHFQWSMVSAVLAIVAGLIVAVFPLTGVITLVVVIAAWLALDGASSWMIGLGLRRAGAPAWGWSIASAVADWILAIALLLMGPVGGAVVVGVVVGIDLALGGISLVMLGRAARSAA